MSKKNLFIDKNIGRVGDYVDEHVNKTKNLKNNIPPFSSDEKNPQICWKLLYRE